LEWVKPGFEQSMSRHVYDRTIAIYEQLLQLLHPYMPFITEEIYHALKDRISGDDLMVRSLPEYKAADTEVLKQGAFLQELITSIRDTRNKILLKPKDTIKLWIDTQSSAFYNQALAILSKQVNAESVAFVKEAKAGCISIVVQTDKLYVETTAANIDTGAQREQLQKELDYLKGFLVSVEKKLGNERFVQNAKPEIIAVERKKQQDAEAKIKTIEESLSLL
jgi:valyl-tRNA synthetase